MHSVNLHGMVGALGVLLLLGASVNCSHSAKKYPLQGQVISKSADSGQITVTHAAIPGLMPAMTATFRVNDAAVIQNLQPGDKIAAQLVEDRNSNDYLLEDVRITDQAQLGPKLYHDNCAECHDNPQPDLHKQPPNLHGLFLHKTLPSGVAVTEMQLHKAIIEGVGTMPAFDQRLNEREIDELVKYLRQLK